MADGFEQFNTLNGQINGHGIPTGNNDASIQPAILVANESPLFSDHNGLSAHQSTNGNSASFGSASLRSDNLENGGDFHGPSLEIQAGLILGSSPASKKRAVPGNSKIMGARVTRTIKSSDENIPTITTTVISPDGAKGATVRPNYSTELSSSNSSGKKVLGTITTGDVKRGDKKQNHQQKPVVAPTEQVIIEPPKPETFEIFVKNVDGKNHTFTVKKTDLVDDLLLQVQERLRLREDQFWLSHGKKLQKGNTLGYYRLAKHGTVYLQGPCVGG